MLSTTTSNTDDHGQRGVDNWRGARSVHADTETVLRVLFKVARSGSGRPHRYYRAILRESDGTFHLAGGHVVVAPGGEYAEDTTASTEPPLWIERDIGLRGALKAVNHFVPTHQSDDIHIAAQFLSGRSKCRVLWKRMQRRRGEKNGDGDPESAVAPETPAPPSEKPAQTSHAPLSPTSLQLHPSLD